MLLGPISFGADYSESVKQSLIFHLHLRYARGSETLFRGRQHRKRESFDVYHHGLRHSVNLVTNQAKSVVLSTTMPLARSAGCQATGSSGAREALQSNPISE